MVLDSGTLTVWRGVNTTPPGGMPEMDYTHVWTSYYGEKTVGVTRFYSAQQYGARPDILVRVPRNHALNAATDVVRLHPFSYKDTNEYSILQIQHIVDEDGLPATELSLQKTDIDDEEFEVKDDGENP